MHQDSVSSTDPAHDSSPQFYLEQESDLLIGSYTAESQGKLPSGLPEFPTCPGPDLVPHERTVSRPQPSPIILRKAPHLAQIYIQVVKAGLPNFMGAKVPVPHQLNITKWKEFSPMIRDKQLVQFLEFGFPVGYTGAQPPTLNLPNHSSAIKHPLHVDTYLATEVDKVAIPLDSQPFTEWWRVNPLMTRPKRDSNKMRVILDLSFPQGFSVNSEVPKNSLGGSQFKMRLPKPNALAARIQALGPTCLLYKVDLSRAYRQLRSDPFDWPFLGVHWDTSHYLNIAIPFGLRHGASACQKTTQAVADITEAQVGAVIHPHVADSSGAALPGDATVHYNHLLQVMNKVGLDAALEKCQAPAPFLSYRGHLRCSEYDHAHRLGESKGKRRTLRRLFSGNFSQPQGHATTNGQSLLLHPLHRRSS